eukprot:CAMPEP_0201281250 /NCGR_PEP_ID=MMETSP1317-20130820/2054_1 /ASSEMBLY_ACC=CAM_ASM_000770 /TAXON_ID=187299 /ORGANISM="Undescribed Undescribed, Strain Undescribed" /LENGTH=69 /DNA_ID=CAMNT_0047590591 /DNA_START=757 /DNA_END=966 /DNA_ORIENTATION=-
MFKQEEDEEEEEEESSESQTYSPPKEVNADEQFLNDLYVMGFPLELSKKALIETKNSGLEVAIDLIMKM